MADGPVQQSGLRSPILWGVILIGFGFGTTALDWYRVRHGGEPTPFAEFVTPFLGFIGVATLVAPDPEHIIGAQEQRPGFVWQARRRAAQIILALGVLASFADFAAIHGWLR
ncbi:MAG TPA: hypothetical protein VGF56_16375 [Rhizomicrobium sp.]|jgi:hypothetical protein